MNPLTAIGVLVLAVAVGWIGGCVRGEHNGETERMELTAQRDNAIAGANACGSVLEEVNAKVAANQVAWNRAQKRAMDAEARANEAAKTAEAEAARATGALLAAKRNATCNAQLEVALCDSIPLL